MFSVTSSLIDSVSYPGWEEPFDKYCKREYFSDVTKEVLNEKEQHVLHNHYYMARSYEDISTDGIYKRDKVSRQYVDKIKKEAVKKITLRIIEDSLRLSPIVSAYLSDKINVKLVKTEKKRRHSSLTTLQMRLFQ